MRAELGRIQTRAHPLKGRVARWSGAWHTAAVEPGEYTASAVIILKSGRRIAATRKILSLEAAALSQLDLSATGLEDVKVALDAGDVAAAYAALTSFYAAKGGRGFSDYASALLLGGVAERVDIAAISRGLFSRDADDHRAAAEALLLAAQGARRAAAAEAHDV